MQPAKKPQIAHEHLSVSLDDVGQTLDSSWESGSGLEAQRLGLEAILERTLHELNREIEQTGLIDEAAIGRLASLASELRGLDEQIECLHPGVEDIEVDATG